MSKKNFTKHKTGGFFWSNERELDTYMSGHKYQLHKIIIRLNGYRMPRYSSIDDLFAAAL